MQHTLQTTISHNKEPATFTFTMEIDLLEALGICPANPKTLGSYIRKARLQKDLTAKALAQQIGCSAEVVLQWGKDKRIPALHYLKELHELLNIPKKFLRDAVTTRSNLPKPEKIMLFELETVKKKIMGCLNEAKKAGMGERNKMLDEHNFDSLFRTLRLSLFMSHRELAKTLRVDPSTLLDWENQRNMPYGKTTERIKAFITKAS